MRMIHRGRVDGGLLRTANAWDAIVKVLRPGEVFLGAVVGRDPHVLTRWQAQSRLQEFPAGPHVCGGWEPFFLWTSERLIWVHEYDTEMRLGSAPIRPTPCYPSFNGAEAR